LVLYLKKFMKDKILNYFFISFLLLSAVLFFPNKSDIFELPRYHFFSLLIFLFTILKPEKKFLLPEKLSLFHFFIFFLFFYSLIYFIFSPSLPVFSHIIFLISVFLLYNILNSFNNAYKNYCLFFISLIGFFEAIYGIFQYFNLDPIFEIVLKTEEKRMQMAGTIGIPAIYGIFLGITLIVQIYLFFQKKKFFYLFLFFLTSISFFLNNTRSAIFGLFLGILFLIKENKIKILLSLFFLFLFSFFIFFKADFKKRWDEIFDLNKTHSGTIRLFYWKITYEAIKEKPIIGSGPLSFSRKYFEKEGEILSKDKSKAPEVIQPLLNAHNDFLQIWLEDGIIGLAFLILIFLKGIFFEKNNLKKAVLIFVFFTSLFLFPLNHPSTLIVSLLIYSLKL